ncbi:hypothetical protein [Bradyrhizobium sp. Ce-3]|uniref:hypothetical protein n=1 Tax=Bradyrhizobium sp. Ce-3 TaxID=2913970 RepID=UPI001FC889B2|nr:hypothetical protein [Bradyrhizobium sp. Ce-3]
MITLTADDGASFQINGDSVVRIRRTTEGEATFAKTHIDWVTLKFAREDPSAVADLVGAENSKLAELPSPDGSPVWFDCRLAKGPVWFGTGAAPSGTKSAFVLANKTQYVAATPEDVQATMTKFGGTALPIPTTGVLVSLKGLLRSIVGSSGTPTAWE